MFSIHSLTSANIFAVSNIFNEVKRLEWTETDENSQMAKVEIDENCQRAEDDNHPRMIQIRDMLAKFIREIIAPT